jgi:hypothetical protein
MNLGCRDFSDDYHGSAHHIIRDSASIETDSIAGSCGRTFESEVVKTSSLAIIKVCKSEQSNRRRNRYPVNRANLPRSQGELVQVSRSSK